jgi:hypothetical protein
MAEDSQNEIGEISSKVKWYHLVACFFAGIFLANAVPHYINGISGDAFPTPFANPPGVGLSAPVVNVSWALINVVFGYVLVKVGRLSDKNKWSIAAFFAGVVLISLVLSIHFASKALGT